MDDLEKINSELFDSFDPEDEIFVGGTTYSGSVSWSNKGSDGSGDFKTD
jgi:hypothetical protein